MDRGEDASVRLPVDAEPSHEPLHVRARLAELPGHRGHVPRMCLEELDEAISKLLLLGGQLRGWRSHRGGLHRHHLCPAEG